MTRNPSKDMRPESPAEGTRVDEADTRTRWLYTGSEWIVERVFTEAEWAVLHPGGTL